MSQLLDQLRILIEDPDSADFTDDQLNVYLNKYRGYIEGLALQAESTDYLVWYSPYKNLDNRSLRSDSSTVILEATYDYDDLNGIFTFTDAQTSVYLYANFYNLEETAADVWLVRAAQAKFSGDVKLGDEVVPSDKFNRTFCIQKYWMLKTSTNGQMDRGY